MNIIQLSKKVEELEKKQAPNNSHICLVRAGQDRDETVAQFIKDNDVKGSDKLHVIRFRSRENRI